jgi:hypothetical protein
MAIAEEEDEEDEHHHRRQQLFAVNIIDTIVQS